MSSKKLDPNIAAILRLILDSSRQIIDYSKNMAELTLNRTVEDLCANYASQITTHPYSPNRVHNNKRAIGYFRHSNRRPAYLEINRNTVQKPIGVDPYWRFSKPKAWLFLEAYSSVSDNARVVASYIPAGLVTQQISLFDA